VIVTEPGTSTTPPTTTQGTTTTPAPALPSRSGVELSEYRVHPTRSPLAAGPVRLDVTNYGMDDHDLTVSQNGTVLAQTPVVSAQGKATLSVALAAGDYKIYCSLYDHDQLGMHATLRVQ
jgi:hypothetical protein